LGDFTLYYGETLYVSTDISLVIRDGARLIVEEGGEAFLMENSHLGGSGALYVENGGVLTVHADSDGAFLFTMDEDVEINVFFRSYMRQNMPDGDYFYLFAGTPQHITSPYTLIRYRFGHSGSGVTITYNAYGMFEFALRGEIYAQWHVTLYDESRTLELIIPAGQWFEVEEGAVFNITQKVSLIVGGTLYNEGEIYVSEDAEISVAITGNLAGTGNITGGGTWPN
jgi:hypothetical protein